jgi:hypothetical protein
MKLQISGLRSPQNLFTAILTGALLALAGIGRADQTLVPAGSAWKYSDSGADLGTAWRQVTYSDTAWASGAAELGYGDGDEATTVSFGSNASAKYITTYFRGSFTVADPAAFSSLKIRLLRDDGAVVYLNGVEVRRDNLPTGSITAATLASTALGAPAEDTFYETTIPVAGLVAGTNVLAVEIHQSGGTSSDVSFDLELIGVTPADPGAVTLTRGPYLQKTTSSQINVRWRTSASSDSVVRFGTDPANLTSAVSDTVSTTEHEVTLTGLQTDTQYYYSVGSSVVTLAAGSEFTFFTHPAIGSSVPTRIWVLGDCGTGGDGTGRAESVRNAYTSFAGSRYTDVFLMLGDNAYDSGTDAEFQRAVFDTYPSFLRQTSLWSAIGNHETAQATTVTDSLPYFQMFSFPKAGEAGGVPSGTEKYYSFDYGDIHFVCLDSMTSSRIPGSAMLTWLENDLASTSQRWIVAFWHHPPYTKGSHNSDTETELIEMRQNVLPILEAGGVDLVLGGHSHCYERSMLIDGHYGLSSTFSSQYVVDGGNGSESGTGAYLKPDGLAANQGAVYAVAGSSGKISSWTGGSTASTNPTPHPVMVTSLRQLGSMVIDVNGSRMDVRFLRETGAVDDSFTINKSVANVPPTVTITSPASGTTLNAPATINVAANAADPDGNVVQVDFYSGDTLIGSDTTAPFEVSWSGVPAGSYSLTASATDNLGATSTSAPVSVQVVSPPPPPSLPAAPSGLTAAGLSRSAIALNWTDNASNEDGFRIERSGDGRTFKQIATVGVDATSFTDTGLAKGKLYYYRVRAYNGTGNSPYTATVSARTLR